MTLGSRRSAGTRAILRELPAPVLGPLAQAPLKATSKIRNRVKSSSRTRGLVQVEEGHQDQPDPSNSCQNQNQNHPHHQVLRQARDHSSSSSIGVGTAIAGTQQRQSPGHRLPSEEGEEAEEEQAERQATVIHAPEEESRPSTRGTGARSNSQVSLAAPSSSSSSLAGLAGRLTASPAVDPGLITVRPQAAPGPSWPGFIRNCSSALYPPSPPRNL